METFKCAGDDKHLYLKSIEASNSREELAAVMKVFTDRGCIISDRIVGPDCTLYPCKLEEFRFAVCDASIDGEGIILCVDDDKTMKYLEDILKEKK